MQEQLKDEYRIIRQDVTRQTLLFDRIGLTTSPAYAYYENGKLIKIEK